MMFWSVPRMWDGATVAILATGPSLTEEDVQDLSYEVQWPNFLAIHLSYRLVQPVATDDMLFAADPHRSWRHYPELVEFPGLKACLLGRHRPDREPAPEKVEEARRLHEEHGVKVLRHLAEHVGLSDDPGVVRGNNGIHQGINIAVLAGAKRILLLGADLKPGPGGELYWHGEKHPWQEVYARLNFPAQIASIETTVAPLRERGIEVLNLCLDSALTCFPRVTLKEALG